MCKNCGLLSSKDKDYNLASEVYRCKCGMITTEHKDAIYDILDGIRFMVKELDTDDLKIIENKLRQECKRMINILKGVM